MSTEICIVTHITDKLVDSIQHMLPQLSPLAAELKHDEVAQIVSAPCCTLFMARDVSRDEMVGTLTLVVFRALTGIKARIEDVIVDKRARGQGIGTALIQRALDHASSLQAHTVELTSRPSRRTANSLYRRLGFVQRNTNVYCYEIG